MSRVKIKDLYWELDNDQSNLSWDNTKELEIVPRKIVEMIIEECERDEITNFKYGNYCAGENLKHIREYAESLLEQFEKEGE